MIPEDRARTILEIAYDQIRSFVKDSSIQPGRLVELATPNTAGQDVRVSNEATNFANHVVLTQLTHSWGTPGFPTLERARVMPLFRAVPLILSQSQVTTPQSQQIVSHAVVSELFGFPTWLYMTRRDGKQTGGPQYAAVYDQAFLKTSRHASQNPDIVINRLFFHELGHFVLHRQELFTPLHETIKDPEIAAIQASERHEEEAWYYASVIVGVALGDHAFSVRRKGESDDTWALS